MISKSLIATLGILCCAIPVAAQEQARGTYTLRSALNSDIRGTQPGGNRDFNTDVVLTHVVEGLVALDERAAVVPMLAEKVDISGDGRTYTFTLRNGVTFQNGAPMTSAEVLWSLKRYMDPATQWRCLPDLDGTSGTAKITGMTAPDPRTVEVQLEQPAGLFLSTLARPDCGGTGILHPASAGSDGAWLKPIGTGPYSMGEWRRGQYVELERYDGYASRPGPRDGLAGGKQALAAKLRFLVIPDSSAMSAALLAGNIDVMPDVPSTELTELRGKPDVSVMSAPTLGNYVILLQTREPVLSDARVRRALMLSLDIPEIVTSVIGDDAPPNASPIPVSSSFYDAVQKTAPKRDVAAAKKLLAEAGYKGQTIRIVTNRRYPNSYDVSIAAQAMAAEAGIKLELEVLDWATQLDRYARGDYQALAFNFSARLDPSLSWEVLVGPKATQPRKVWDDPEAIALVQKSTRTTDRNERQAIFNDLYRRFLVQVPAIELWNTPDYIAVRRNVQGAQPWAAGLTRLWGVSRS
jgi:peptide/nickel transport system substrate-binding protein